jgi:hypothetical protein
MPVANYAAYSIRVFDPNNYSNSEAVPIATREHYSDEDICMHIIELNVEGPDVIKKKSVLWISQQEQINLITEEMTAREGTSGFEWNLAQLEDFSSSTTGVRSIVVYLRRMVRGQVLEVSYLEDVDADNNARGGGGYSRWTSRPGTSSSYTSSTESLDYRRRSRSSRPSFTTKKPDRQHSTVGTRTDILPRDKTRYEYERELAARRAVPDFIRPIQQGLSERQRQQPTDRRDTGRAMDRHEYQNRQNSEIMTRPAVPLPSAVGLGSMARRPTQEAPLRLKDFNHNEFSREDYRMRSRAMMRYPEHYDDRKYDPLNKDFDDNIVKGLLLEWTPAGDEQDNAAKQSGDQDRAERSSDAKNKSSRDSAQTKGKGRATSTGSHRIGSTGNSKKSDSDEDGVFKSPKYSDDNESLESFDTDKDEPKKYFGDNYF